MQQITDILFGINGFAAMVSWLFWNILWFSFYKDANEKTFQFKPYCLEHWDNWLRSLFAIPFMLLLGYYGFNFKQFNIAEGLDIGNAWPLLSGVLPEILMELYKKFKPKAQ